jgi:hypothetical protein
VLALQLLSMQRATRGQLGRPVGLFLVGERKCCVGGMPHFCSGEFTAAICVTGPSMAELDILKDPRAARSERWRLLPPVPDRVPDLQPGSTLAHGCACSMPRQARLEPWLTETPGLAPDPPWRVCSVGGIIE